MKEAFEHSDIKEHFFKLRMKAIKLIAPRFYKKAQLLGLTDGFAERVYNIFPRPAIAKAKELFNNNEVIVAEIGVLRGINSESILKELNIKELYLIDIWNNYEGFDMEYSSDVNYQITLDKFKDKSNVFIIKEFSHIAVNLFDDNYFDIVYIDGNHSFEYAYNDLCLWYQKTKQYGLIGGHDIISRLGVLRAVKLFCIERNLKFFIHFPDFYIIKE